MSSVLWWIFDALVILTAVYVIYSNGKRGFTKVLILCIGYILTTLLASVVAGVAAPVLYESIARDNNIAGFESVDHHLDFVKVFTKAMEEKKYGIHIDQSRVREYLTGEDRGEFDSNLYHYANLLSGTPVSSKAEFQKTMLDAFVAAYGYALNDRLPRYVQMNMRFLVEEDPQLMRDTISDFYNPKLTAHQKAEAAEERFARKPTAEVLQIFVYFIVFSVIMIIVAIFSALLQRRIFFNIREGTDHAVGAIFGLLEAGAMIIVLTLLVRLIILLSGGQYRLFSPATIEKTKVFSFFYHNISRLL